MNTYRVVVEIDVATLAPNMSGVLEEIVLSITEHITSIQTNFTQSCIVVIDDASVHMTSSDTPTCVCSHQMSGRRGVFTKTKTRTKNPEPRRGAYCLTKHPKP